MSASRGLRNCSVLLMSSLLCGCGNRVYDCAADDVIDTVRQAMIDAMKVDELKPLIADRLKIDSIATLSADKELGRYSCKANFSYSSPSIDKLSRDLEYDITPIVSGDADFEIAYNQTEFANFAGEATRAEYKDGVDKRNEDRAKQLRAELMASLIPLPREEAIRQLNETYRQDDNLPTIVPTQLNTEVDDVEDFDVLWPWYGTPENEMSPRQAYMLSCVHQVSNVDGEPMMLHHVGGTALPAGAIPADITVDGSNIMIKTTDSSQLPYECVAGRASPRR